MPKLLPTYYTKVSAESLPVFFQCIVEANWKILKSPWHFIADVYRNLISKAVITFLLLAM